jgi:hypothetical protein
LTRITRRLLIGLVALLALLGVASFVLWRSAEAALEQGFADWRAQATAQGYTVAAGAMSRGGWPLSADLSVEDFSVMGAAGYTAQRIVLRLDPRTPTLLRVLGEGAQSLRLGTAAVPFTAERLALSVPVVQPASAALDAKNLAFADGSTVGLLEGQADWATAKAVDVRVSVEAITLPESMHAALGPHIASATVEGVFAGAIPTGAADAEAAAKAWRDSGGAVDVRRIALGWGPLGVSGSASVKLDAALQPDATATLRLVGMEETLTALAAAHVIAPRAAQTAKAVAGLMAHAPDGGGAPGVEVPLTLHEGTLSLGMIPLAVLPKLDWSAAP